MPLHSHEHSGNATFPATAMTRRDPRATVQDGNRVLCRGEDAVFLLHHATGLGMGSVRKSDKVAPYALQKGDAGRPMCVAGTVCFVRFFLWICMCVLWILHVCAFFSFFCSCMLHTFTAPHKVQGVILRR